MKTQTKEKMWIDHNDNVVPRERCFQYERQSEISISRIAKKAIDLEAKLKAFKKLCEEEVEKIYKKYCEDKKITYDNSKGFTAFLFDRSIKVERDAQKITGYDENILVASFSEFQLFLDDENASPILSKIVEGAFKSKGDRLDKGQIQILLSHQTDDSVKDNEHYQKACELLKAAKMDAGVKHYYRVYEGVYPNDYKLINLNFSNI
jgi:hypothetical protein